MLYFMLGCWESTGTDPPVLSQHQNPKRTQSLQASHLRDVVVTQVEENKIVQMRQVLYLCDSVVLEAEKLQLIHRV